MNKEAWKLLKCAPPQDGGEILCLDDVICYDVGNCSVLKPLD